MTSYKSRSVEIRRRMKATGEPYSVAKRAVDASRRATRRALPSGPAIVTLVPMGKLGRRYLDHHVYIRDQQLRGQIHRNASYLGWSGQGEIYIAPFTSGQWRMGSAAAISSTGIANLSAITTEPDLNSNWPGPATLVELGAPARIGLPLGFAPNPTGGASALPGVRHHLLVDLLAAAHAGATLMDVPKA